MRVADYIADAIVQKGTNKIFTLSGGGFMHLLDGLVSNKSLELIFHHHEQAAGMAAEAFARSSGKVGVCFATSGPGATNLVTAILGAWLDSVPVIFITGQSKLSQTIRNAEVTGLRQFGTFEVDIVSIVKPITKDAYFVRRSNDIPYILEKAFQTAAEGRPGPVLIDIPIDIQGAQIDVSKTRKYQSDYNKPTVQGIQLDQIVDKINKSKRPIILAGHGVRVSGSADKLQAFIELYKIPAVTTQLGKDVLPYECEFFIGHPGTRGDRAGNSAIQTADLIIVIGSSLHTFTTGYELDLFAPNAFIIQIDPDRSNFEKESVHVEMKVNAEISDFIETLSNRKGLLTRSRSDEWLSWIKNNKLKYPVSREAHKIENGRINIYHAIETIEYEAPSDAVVIGDAGSVFFALGHAWKVKKGQRVLISGGLGTMGWSLPAATGSASACPKSKIICFTGDGSLMTNIHELSIIKGHNLNIAIMIFNNSGYISIKNTQQGYFGNNFAGVNVDSGVFIPKIEDLAKSMQIKYKKVFNLAELRDCCVDTFNEIGPVLIDIQSNLDQEIIPAVLSKKMDNGQMISQPLDNMYPFLDRPLTWDD